MKLKNLGMPKTNGAPGPSGVNLDKILGAQGGWDVEGVPIPTGGRVWGGDITPSPDKKNYFFSLEMACLGAF